MIFSAIINETHFAHMVQKLRKLKLSILSAYIAVAVSVPWLARAADATAAKEQDPQLGWLANNVVTATQAIIQMIVGMLGKLTVQLIHILIMVASYNGYMDSPAITTGWTIVRDVANLFFVAIILVISIGSIVSPERFGGAKKILHVLVYAVFVNFSRTIAALFIDISQLVMLTFVNGFAAAAGGNFVEALGITKLTDVQPGGSALTFSSIMGGLFLALIMFVIITVIIAVMVVALVIRMVMLWMLVVLSPIAFAMAPYERTHEYYAKWWKDLETQLTAGPIVAFFLWLSLVSFQGSTGSDLTGQKLVDNPSGTKEAVSLSCGDTIACSEENMIRFIVATVMLLAGLGFAQEFGGVGGSLAGSALAAGKKYASSAVRFTARKAALPVAAVATGPVGIAAAGVVLASRSQRLRNIAGKTLASVPGARGVGLRLQANVAKERLEKVKKAEETARFATWQQMRGRSYSLSKDKAGNVISAREDLSVPMETAYANYKLLAKNKDFMAEASPVEKQFIMDKLTDHAKVMNDKEGLDLVTEIERANPHLISAAKKASDPTYNKDKFGQPVADARFKEIRATSSTSDDLKLDPIALKEIKVVATLSASSIKKILDDGTPAQFDALSETLKKFADRSNKEISAADRDAFYEKITDNKRSVDTLSVPELQAADMIIEVMKKPPTKDREDLFKNKEKKRVIGETALKKLDEDRSQAGFASYSADQVLLAEAIAVSQEKITDAFNYGKQNAGAFDDTESEDAFRKALHGKSQPEVALAVDINEIDASTQAGRAMAEELTAADILSLVKKAEGNPAKNEKIKKLIDTIRDMASVAGRNSPLDLKFQKLQNNQITSQFT
jgi:hypothetical protein